MTRGKSICNVLATGLLLTACSVSSPIVPSPKEDSCKNVVEEETDVVFHPCEKEAIVVPIPYRPDYVDEDKVYDVVDEMPSFPGGPKAMFDYLAENVQYPKEIGETCAQGRVIISFIIEKDGSITEPTVVKSIHPALDKEALRVVRSMPKWTPGSQNGVRVRVKYVIPVTFRLE